MLANFKSIFILSEYRGHSEKSPALGLGHS